MKNIKLIFNQNGVAIVIVAISIIALLGVAAIAIDLGYLYIVKGELQNAADAGALAGAQVLYINDGTSVNPGANAMALDYVNQNFSEKAAVQVKSIERGHWSFSTRTFTPNPSLEPVSLVNVSTAALDTNIDFINAIRVITTRKTVDNQPAQPFFARIFGIPGFVIEATAVAYIGFAGTLPPFGADQPIAICREALLSGEDYVCNVGRMLSDTGDTAGWTNFEQPTSCSGAASANTVSRSICKGNANPIVFGSPLMATNGVLESSFQDLRECWSPNLKNNRNAYPERTTSWRLTLPVIECGSDIKVQSCENVVGAVNIEVVWITSSGKDPKFENVPVKMDNWKAPLTPDTEENRKSNWNHFVDHFNLKLPDGQPAYWNNKFGSNTYGYGSKTVYFKPSCTMHKPIGLTGGQNFGILAEIPVLVK